MKASKVSLFQHISFYEQENFMLSCLEHEKYFIAMFDVTFSVALIAAVLLWVWDAAQGGTLNRSARQRAQEKAEQEEEDIK